MKIIGICSLCDKDKIKKYFFFLKSRRWPFGQAKETKSTNISFISLHLKLLTNMTSQGKGISTRNKETNVSLFAGTWETLTVTGISNRTDNMYLHPDFFSSVSTSSCLLYMTMWMYENFSTEHG